MASFLKKLGIVLAKGLQVAVGVNPFVPEKYQDELRIVTDTLVKVSQAVVSAEAFSAMLEQPIPGTEKLRLAGGLAAPIIIQSALVGSRRISNPELFKQGCTSITSGVADVLNSLDGTDLPDADA